MRKLELKRWILRCFLEDITEELISEGEGTFKRLVYQDVKT